MIFILLQRSVCRANVNLKVSIAPFAFNTYTVLQAMTVKVFYIMEHLSIFYTPP